MNINKAMIIEELNNRGLVVEERTVVKNGVEKEALAVRTSMDDSIAPTIYPEEVIKSAEEFGLSFEQVMEKIQLLISAKLSFNVEQFTEPDYIMSHVRIGVQREGSEDLVKRKSDFEGLEEYLYIAGEGNEGMYSAKVNPKMLEIAGLIPEEVFEAAEKNNHEDFTAQTMEEILAEMMGKEAPPCFEMPSMYVISNKRKYRGASAMLDKKGIGELADKIGVHEFILLPSSIHECILVPKTYDVDTDVCENMVKEVNGSVVDELEQLIDRAYVLTA